MVFTTDILAGMCCKYQCQDTVIDSRYKFMIMAIILNFEGGKVGKQRAFTDRAADNYQREIITV